MNQKQKVSLIILVVAALGVFLSITYAFINVNLVGIKNQVITSGNLTLILDEDDNNLQIHNAMPMYDEVGMIQEAFTFRVINESTMNVNYALRLIDITSGERLDKRIVKYGLEKEDETQIDYLSTLHDGIISKEIIKPNQTIHYSLRLWIDSSVENESLIKDKKLSYKVELVYGQVLVDGDFQYGIEGSKLTDKQIEIKPYTSEQVDLTLTSFNNVDTGYELYYKVISPSHTVDGIEAGYLNSSESMPDGIIQKDGVKNIQLMFNNMTNETIQVEIGIKSDLVQNEWVFENDEKTLSKEIIQKYYVYDYTGDYQTFKAPKDGTYKVELWGGGTERKISEYGGGYTSGNIFLGQNELLYVYVGGVGKKATNTTGTTGGGYNGGGNGGYYAGSLKDYTFGGGGATDVRLLEGTWNDSNSLRSRIMVAGASNGANDKAAGGLEGYGDSIYYLPGTQTSGYAFGYGESSSSGFGGGGGYYGGHTGSGGWNGAGGSSFISGHAGCIAITSEDDQTPKVSEYSKIEDSYHYSGKIFTDTVMIDGRGYNWSTEILEKVDMPTHDLTSTMVGNNGNGYARITYLGD